jgi:GYF domain 2
VGIRFKCHQCGRELHVKDFQAGKRSKCPECSVRFRIPNQSADFSIPLGSESAAEEASTETQTATHAIGETTKTAISLADSPKTNSSSVKTPASSSRIATNGSENQESEQTAPESTIPQPLREAPQANWYVQPPTGGQYGPASSEVFGEWLAEHRVTRDSLVWSEGWEQWQLAGEVFSESFAPPSTLVPKPKVPFSHGGTESSTAVSPANTSASTLERARLAKKMKRKRNYMVMISILAVISLGLIIALIVVLSM